MDIMRVRRRLARLLDPETFKKNGDLERAFKVAGAKSKGDRGRSAEAIESDFKAISPREHTGADAEYVLEQYEAVWTRRMETARRRMDAGESLAHIMAHLRPPMHQAKGYKRVSAAVANKLVQNGQLSADGVALARLSVCDSRFTIVPNFDPIYAVFKLAAKAKNVVEFGAGPGWNLFDLSIHLGNAVKRKALFGLEYTQAGVDFMNMINGREGLPLTAHRFDYTKPDLSMVPDDGHTLFFSHHSIEQVETISPELYKQILARKSSATLVHIEPIGWQRFPEMMRARKAGARDMRSLAAIRTTDLTSDRAPAINSALNSWRAGYNTNALGLIRQMEENPRAKISLCLYDFNHRYNHNAANPSTYVEVDIAERA